MTKANIKIAPSSVINYGGLDCIILDVEQDRILVLAKESIGNMPFDEGNSNNFPKGTLCKYLNGEFIKQLKANGADTSALIPTTIDLTSDDGLKDYGETTQKIPFSLAICTVSIVPSSLTSMIGGGSQLRIALSPMGTPTTLGLSTRVVVCTTALLTMVSMAFVPLSI